MWKGDVLHFSSQLVENMSLIRSCWDTSYSPIRLLYSKAGDTVGYLTWFEGIGIIKHQENIKEKKSHHPSFIAFTYSSITLICYPFFFSHYSYISSPKRLPSENNLFPYSVSMTYSEIAHLNQYQGFCRKPQPQSMYVCLNTFLGNSRAYKHVCTLIFKALSSHESQLLLFSLVLYE